MLLFSDAELGGLGFYWKFSAKVREIFWTRGNVWRTC